MFFAPFDETPLPSSLVQILKHLNIVEVEIEKPTNSHRKFTSGIKLEDRRSKMQEREAEKEPNFVANCISQNIETCAKRVPTGLSEVFTPYRVLPNNSLLSLYK